MTTQLLIFCAVMTILTVIMYADFGFKSKLSMRKSQAQGMLKENVLKKKLEEIANEKVKYSKRYKIETMCLQAGFKLSYVEFVVLGLISSVIIGGTVGTIMNNPILGVMFLFIGYLAPGQVVCLLKNRRITILENQIGAFMKMFLKRLEATKDAKKSLNLTMNEFAGEQPMYGELKEAVLEIELGVPINDAFDNLARRTGNKYMYRLSDYYKISSHIGTEEVRKSLLEQAYVQFEENRQAKRFMKKELAGPVREAYVMLASIPMFALYQIMTNKDYVTFMINDPMGKIGTSAIVGVFVGCVWFVNAKIGAPIE